MPLPFRNRSILVLFITAGMLLVPAASAAEQKLHTKAEVAEVAGRIKQYETEGQYDKAVLLSKETLPKTEYGSEAYAEILYRYASALSQDNQDAEATKALKESIIIFERLKLFEDVARSQLRLADVYEGDADYPSAQISIASAKQNIERAKPRSGLMKSALLRESDIDEDLYRFDDSDRSLRAALEIARSVYGEDSSDFASVLFRQQELFRKQARFREAKEALARAYMIDLKLHGQDHFQTSLDVTAMADLCLEISDMECALANATEAMRIDTKIFGNDDPAIADDYNQLATVAGRKGDFANAVRYITEAISIQSKRYGPRSQEVSAMLADEARLYAQWGQHEKALAINLDVLSIDRVFDKDGSADLAEDETRLADSYLACGRLQLARKWINEAIKSDRVTFGDDSVDVAQDRLKLAGLFYYGGEYDAAFDTAKKASTAIGVALGTGSREFADASLTAGEYVTQSKDYPLAVELGERALAIYVHLYGIDHPDTTISREQLAHIYSKTNHPEKADQEMREAVDLAVQHWGPVHPAVARAEMYWGSIAKDRQDYPTATEHYKRALKQKIQFYGSDSWYVSENLSDLADAEYRMGSFVEAITDSNKAISIEVAAGERPFLGSVYNLLGNIYLSRNDLDQSEQSYRKAIAVNRRTLTNASSLSIAPINNLAIVYRMRSQDGLARTYFLKSLAIAKRSELNGALAVYPELGLAAIAMSHDQRAVADVLLKKVIFFYKDKAKTTEYARATGMLGTLAANRGDYAASRKLFKETLEVRQKILGPYHPDLAVAYDNYSYVARKQGSFSEAIEAQEQSSQILDISVSSMLSVGSEEQKLQYAALLARSTWQTVSTFIHIDTPSANELVANLILNRKARALDAAAQVTGRRDESDEERGIREDLNRQKQRLAALVFDPQDAMPQRASRTEDPSVTTKLKAAETGRSGNSSRGGSVRLKTMNASTSANAELRASQVRQTIARISELEGKLVGKGAHASETRTTINTLIPRLGENGVLVDYFVYRQYRDVPRDGHYYGQERLGAYVLSSGSPIILRDLGPLSEIARHVEQLRSAIANVDREKVTIEGRWLYRSIILPYAAAVNTKDRLIVCPDGPLGKLPFASLVTEEGRFLIQTKTIAYVTSARDLLQRQKSVGENQNGQVYVFADPAYSAEVTKSDDSMAAVSERSVLENLTFARLEGTSAEGRAICKLLDCGDNLLTGKSATKSAVLKLKSPDILHIATHGFFIEPQGGRVPIPIDDPDRMVTSMYLNATANPMLMSGLAFAGSNVAQERSRGILTAVELSTVDLSGTRLVVLSACDTGLGHSFNGEGILGLRRALRLAGARTALVSLWKVNDDATSTLMVHFYKHFAAGKSAADSLRDAQLEMLRSPDFGYPMFWASFVADGISTGVLQ